MNTTYNEANENDYKDDIDAKLAWSSKFCNYAFEFFIWLGQIAGKILDVSSQEFDFGIDLVDETACLFDTSFKGEGPLYDRVDILVDSLLSFFPVLHFFHLNLSYILVVVLFLWI